MYIVMKNHHEDPVRVSEHCHVPDRHHHDLPDQRGNPLREINNRIQQGCEMLLIRNRQGFSQSCSVFIWIKNQRLLGVQSVPLLLVDKERKL